MDKETEAKIRAVFPCCTPMEKIPDALTVDDCLEIYAKMQLMREFDLRAKDLWRAGKIRGLCHSYFFGEAIAAGACAALRPGDYTTSTHRGHGHALARGADAGRMMAELLGKAEGCNKGKGGSMHIADVDSGMLGATGIVGSGIAPATGAGLSAKLQKNGSRKCERPGICPGQRDNIDKIMESGAEFLLFGNCSTCADEVVKEATMLKLIHQGDHALMAAGEDLVRRMNAPMEISQDIYTED